MVEHSNGSCFDVSALGAKLLIQVSAVITVCSVHFSSQWYLCAQENPYVHHPLSQRFSQHCLLKQVCSTMQ